MSCARRRAGGDHARKALRMALVRPMTLPPVPYEEPVIEALLFSQRPQNTLRPSPLTAALPDLVPRLRRYEELRIDDDTAALAAENLAGDQFRILSPALMVRRAGAMRPGLEPPFRSEPRVACRTWKDR